MASAITPAWDQEGTLAQATAQIRERVEEQATARATDVHWVVSTNPATDMAAIDGLGSGLVVGSEMVLWRWPSAALAELSALLRDRGGLLVFIEPTAGLGWRRAMQLLGRKYHRDVPAELRAAGFSVTTQVRLRHGFIGTYVRGEARHFPRQPSVMVTDSM